MTLDALPEELQAECTIYLGVTSAGRFGQVNKACKELSSTRRCRAFFLAARDRAVLEKVSSRWCEALAATWRSADGSNLIKFSDGGAKIFKCSCSPDKECRIGMGATNLARHLGSRQHWKHWRLVAFGEAQPTEADWLAFAASAPLAPMRAGRM